MAPPIAAEPKKPRRARRPGSRPIIAYLIVLALVVLLPAITFSALLLQRNNQTQEEVLNSLIAATSRSIVQALEREVSAKIATLRVLATSPELADGDFRAFDARTRRALAGSNTFLFLLDQDLMSFLSTRGTFGDTPVRTNDPVSAADALESHEVVVSNALIGRVSQTWVYNILMPIFLPGQEPMVMALNQSATDLSSVVLANKLPDGWNAAMVDRQGTIIAASDSGGMTGEIFSLFDVNRAAPGWRTVSSSEQDFRALVQLSPLTGWTLVAWTPTANIAKPLYEAMWSLIVGGVLLAGCAVLGVYFMGLQISRSVRGLARDARQLGKGEPVDERFYPITEINVVSAALADASRQRIEAEAEVRFLMRELAHRSKNQMTVIAAMAKQTATGARSLSEFLPAFEQRIHGLARSTDLLLANSMVGVDLRDLFTRQLEPFGPVDTEHVSMEGPDLRLNAQAAQILGLAAHELATNAVKYGAFANDQGRLALNWVRSGDRLDLTWRERVAPQRRRRAQREGFGTTVLNSMLKRALKAEVTRTLHADGIEWRFSFPLAMLNPDLLAGDEPTEGATPVPEGSPAQ